MKIDLCTRLLALVAASGLLLAGPSLGFAQQQQPAPPAAPPAQAQEDAPEEAASPQAEADANVEADAEASADQPAAPPAQPSADAPQEPAQPQAPDASDAAPQPSQDQPLQQQDQPLPDQPTSDQPQPQSQPQPPGQLQRNGQSQLNGQAPREQAPELNLGAEFTTQENRLVVSNLEQDAVLARAGVQQGDVIVSAFGRPITSQVEFLRIIQTAPATQPVPVVVLRDGQQQVIQLHVQEIRQYRGETPGAMQSQPWLGVTFDIRYQDRAVVADVLPSSPAEEAGLAAGDWIMTFNGQQVTGINHLIQMVRSSQPGQDVQMSIGRLETYDVNTTLGEKPRVPESAGIQSQQSLTAEGQLRPAGPDRIEMRGYRGQQQQLQGEIESRQLQQRSQFGEPLQPQRRVIEAPQALEQPQAPAPEDRPQAPAVEQPQESAQDQPEDQAQDQPQDPAQE